MLQSPIANTVANVNRELCSHGCRYALIYVDASVNGQVSVRMSSNVEPQHIAGMLGSMLEPGEAVKQILSDLFKAHPMVMAAPIDPENPPAPDATPVLVEVPVEQAVEMVLATLLTNLQLKGAKPASPIIQLG
jgi:hypothetical protein